MAGMYSAKVMEHFAHPHNVGEIPDANGEMCIRDRSSAGPMRSKGTLRGISNVTESGVARLCAGQSAFSLRLIVLF